jgi:hypothetical protein
LGITKAPVYKVKSVPRLGHMEFTCPTPRAICAEVVADVAWQALMSKNRSRHRDLKNSIYALYPRRKKDAFKISRVDPEIFRGAMSHSTSVSLDLSDRLLVAQREIQYLRTQLTDTKDTLRAHQMK